jgi:hypothetical protein
MTLLRAKHIRDLVNDTSTALAADLLLKWPSLQLLQKTSLHQICKFFYGHNSRSEEKLQESAIKIHLTVYRSL